MRALGDSVARGWQAALVVALAQLVTGARVDAVPEPAARSADGVEVVFLANEGVLLSDGRHSVLIDGCVREPYSGYGAVPEPVWRRLLAGEAPFDGLAVVLVSHAHADHFQPAAARELLLARPAARWVVHREVAEAIAAGWDRWPEVRERVSAVSLADGEVVAWRRGVLEVDLRRLPHGSAGTLPENLAHVVRIGGRSVVHVGDAQATAADLDRAGLTAPAASTWRCCRTGSGSARSGERRGGPLAAGWGRSRSTCRRARCRRRRSRANRRRWSSTHRSPRVVSDP